MELGKTEGDTAHASNKANGQKKKSRTNRRQIYPSTTNGALLSKRSGACSQLEAFRLVPCSNVSFEPRLQTFGLWETTGHFGLFSFMVCSVIVPEQGLLLLMMLLLLLLLLPCKEFQGSVHQGGVIV